MAFGDKIKELRKKRGLSQQALADQINRLCNTDLKRNTISNYEREKSFPDYYKLIALVNILDTSSDNLLGLNQRPLPGLVSPKIREVIHSGLVEESTPNRLSGEIKSRLEARSNLGKIKYISQKEQNIYIEKYKCPIYIKSLPHIVIPYLAEKHYRAFQLSSAIQASLWKGKVNKGDIIVCEMSNVSESNRQAGLFLTIWDKDGIRILRYGELIQFLGAPNLLEIWAPRTLISYQDYLLNDVSME